MTNLTLRIGAFHAPYDWLAGGRLASAPRPARMLKMDEFTSNQTEAEPPLVQAELVEMSAGTAWEWQEVRPVRPRRRWRLPLLLFVATCFTTVVRRRGGGWPGRRLVGRPADGLALRRPRDDDSGLSRDGPLHPGLSLRGLCQLPILHSHAFSAARHAGGSDRHGAASGAPPGAVRYRHLGTVGGISAHHDLSGRRLATFDPGDTHRQACTVCCLAIPCSFSSWQLDSGANPQGLRSDSGSDGLCGLGWAR